MTAAARPLVTVLTSVYNGERYLAECIESVLAQSYDQWEYIVVDNCSTDGSRELAERYAQKDRRIRVRSTPRFLDVIGSQNTAFRQLSSESKYCKMIHADDWLFPDCLREMVDLAERHPSVGIVGAYRLEDTRVGCDGLPYPSTLVGGRELCRSILLGGPGVFGSGSSILIRSDQVRRRDPFLDESDFHADTSVCYEILRDSDFGFVHQVLTFTRRHPGTQTSRAEALNTYQAGQLRRLVTYGPTFLHREEYERRRAEVLASYYRFLGKSLLEPGAQEIWAYHRSALAALGYPVRWSRMMRALLPFWSRVLMHPLGALRVGVRLPLSLIIPQLRRFWRRLPPPGASGSPVPPSLTENRP